VSGPIVRRAPGAAIVPPGRLAIGADLAACALALVSLSVWWTGGFRTEVVGLPVSVTSWPRVALLAAGVVLARHAWARTPSIVATARHIATRWYRDPITRVTWPVVVTTRVGILVLGLLAISTFGYPQPQAPFRVADGELGNLPARFDAGWYLMIATQGYEYTPNRPDLQQNLVFFPAYPALMHWTSLFFARQVLWSGVFVSIVAFAWALRYLYRLARELMDEDRAAAAVTLLAAYPFAVFYSAPYTEGVFLLALTGAWWHVRRDERWAGFGWGLLAGLTRPNGCLLSIPLALIVLSPLVRHGRLQRPPGGWLSLSDRLVVAAAPGLGMLVYSAYIYDLTGDPFMWIRLQAAWGRDNIGAATFLSDEWRSLVKQGAYQYVTGNVPNFLNAAAGLFVAASIVPVWRRYGAPSAALLALNLLPSIASGGWLSVGRATSVLFPMFLWLADAIPARHRVLWGAGFAAVQAFAAVLFFTWRPLY
jgi:hypothetical protein